MKHLFVEVIGQPDNIGDSLLRRGLLDAVRDPEIQLHIQTGSSSDYSSGLGLRDEDVVYEQRAEWVSNLSVDRGRGMSSYLANAGEAIRVRGPRYLRPKLLIRLAGLRRRKGALLHTGVGVRDLDTSPWLAKFSALRYFDMVTWRDAESRHYAGVGDVQPDWGFATGPETIDSSTARDVLAVTARGDRATPTPEWISAVRDLAKALGLRIVTFSQVMRDSDLAADLGRKLHADDVILWDSPSHAVQEHLVRELFRQSAGVISDRVHGLIVGATEGAYPIGLPPRPNAKSIRTLAPVGFPLYIADVSDLARGIEGLAAANLLSQTVAAASKAKSDLASRGAQLRALVHNR